MLAFASLSDKATMHTLDHRKKQAHLNLLVNASCPKIVAAGSHHPIYVAYHHMSLPIHRNAFYYEK
jgi:hypothetical protein